MGFQFPWSKKKEVQEPQAKLDFSVLSEQEILSIKNVLQEKGESEAIIFVKRMTGADLQESQYFVQKLAAEMHYVKPKEIDVASFGEKGDSREVLKKMALDSLTPEDDAELKQLIKEMGTVVAIKIIREKTGVGLLEAKQYAEKLSEELKYSN